MAVVRRGVGVTELDRGCCVSTHSLVEQLKGGLDAPICLTWELTYACNLACVHCLSSSGRRDPRELTTAEAKAVLDELAGLQVFYLNIGGGEPMIRRDFFELVDHAVGIGIGIKFSTNGTYLSADAARRLAAMDYLDVQISLDGVDAATNDPVRGAGSFDVARRAMDHLAAAGFGPFKISRRRDAPQRRPARRVQGAGRRLRRAAAGDAAAAVGARCRLVGVPAPDGGRNSWRCTAGCWSTATTCSPGIRSSTSTRSASRCRG